MITTDSTASKTVKELKAQERAQMETELKAKCEAFAAEKFGANQVAQWSNANKGLWFLPVMKADDESQIEFIGIMKPVNRHILSYASTKLTDGGLYDFLEQCMRDCWVAGDDCILNEDEIFIPAAMQFNKILEGRKASLLKR